MKQVLLAAGLIAVPIAAFAAFQIYFVAATPAAASLGDLSIFKTIVSDVQSVAKTGDFAAAEKRVTDFETAWDNAEATMRPLNTAAWGHIDDAADAAFAALRAEKPDAAGVSETLSGLIAALDNPSGASVAASEAKLVSGIAVTDASGHAIPCEEMLKSLRAAIAGGKITQTNMAAAGEFQSKAMERCNADDDAHADEYSAQGLALAGQ